MEGKWFSNRGQLLQFSLALIACFFSGIQAWPAVQSNQLLTIGPLIFYLLSAVVVIFSVRFISAKPNSSTSPTAVQETRFDTGAPDTSSASTLNSAQVSAILDKPSSKESETKQHEDFFNAKVRFDTFTISIGSFHEIPTNMDPIKISAHNIKKVSVKHLVGKTTRPAVELEIRSGGAVLFSGENVKALSINRFLVPETAHSSDSEDNSIFKFSFTHDYLDFMAIRVDHIDLRSQTATIALSRCRGLKPF